MINNTEITNRLLQAILHELKELNVSVSAPKRQLGFTHAPKTRYIYANRKYPPSLWYFWDGALQQPEPIEAGALTGFIERIEIEEKEFKKQVESKLSLHIRSDRNYVIQSGLDTMFARALLYALNSLPDEAFFAPITIAPEAGDSEQVLFCRVYDASSTAVFAQYSSDTDWAHVIASVTKKINGDRRGKSAAGGNRDQPRPRQYDNSLNQPSLTPTLTPSVAPPIRPLKQLKPQTQTQAQPAQTQTETEIWRTWRSPEDAIAWAKEELPYLTESAIRDEFAKLPALNGKKALAWTKRVQELIEVDF